MSRKRKAPVRKVYPDPKFHSEIVSKFINSIMYDGKRSTAEKILYDALEKIKSKIDKFTNCASFQEMEIDQVKNYKRIIKNILNKNSIDLIIYPGWEKNNTLSPHIINEIFDGHLIERKFYDAVDTRVSLTYLTSL